MTQRCPACALSNPDDLSHCRRCKGALTPVTFGGGGLFGGDGDCWRDGDQLVLRKGSELPARCVHCNAPASASGLKKTFYWHSPGLYILAVFALLLYAIIALMVRKSVTVFVTMCPEHLDRRRKAILGGWVLGLTGFVSLLVAIGQGAIFGWSGLVLLLAGVIWSIVGARGLQPAHIDDSFARFKGVCPEYLSTLPSWRGIA